MKRHSLTTALLGLGLCCSAMASECRLEVEGETRVFGHVSVRNEANPFSDSKDFIVHCFREAIPEDKAGADQIIWFSPDSGSIEITLAAGGQVTGVQVRTPELTASVSGLGFGVQFDGQLDDEGVRGEVTTSEDLVSLHNGEPTAPWRVAATLDSGLAE